MWPIPTWLSGGPYLNGVRETFPLGWSEPQDGSLSPEYVIEQLGRIAGPDAVYVAGVGQHQMWAAQFISYEKPRTWLNSGGLGTMGYAIPAAMGAKMARRTPSVGHRRRRLLPDDQPGTGHLCRGRRADQGRVDQQRQSGHGAPMADAVLRRALQQYGSGHP